MNKNEIVPYLTSGWRIPAILAVVIIVGAIIFWAYSGSGTKEIELNRNIGVIDGNANVKEKIVEEKTNATTQAINTYHAADNRDAGTYHGAGSKPGSDAYCLKYPTDSTCR